jgi:hypothetical protein
VQVIVNSMVMYVLFFIGLFTYMSWLNSVAIYVGRNHIKLPNLGGSDGVVISVEVDMER